MTYFPDLSLTALQAIYDDQNVLTASPTELRRVQGLLNQAEEFTYGPDDAHVGHQPNELTCEGCDVDDNSNVYLRASGYEWTCVCGRLNHIIAATSNVMCGDEYGSPQATPETPSCGREFNVGDHGHCYD